MLKASPWGAFLAELPFKAASAACCRYSATDEGRSPFLIEIFPRKFSIKGRRLFLDFPNIFDKKFLKIKRRDLFSI